MNGAYILNPTILLTSHFSLKWRVIFRLFWTFCILSIITLLIFYVFQINSEISERYSIKEYEIKMEKVSNDNKNLGMNYFQINSLENIVGLLKNLNFEEVGRISYIQVLDNKVVVKQK